MTVSSTTNRVAYTGNGATVAFSVPFLFLTNADLKVYIGTTLQTITTNYTVSGAGNPAGGTVTFTLAPASQASVVIVRDPAITQLTDYIENDDFPANSHEAALDKLTIVAQRLDDRLDRAAVLPDSYSGAASPVLPVPEGNSVIGWNPTGTALQNVDIQTLVTTVAVITARSDVFSGNGSQTVFTLSANPGSVNNLDVSISGVVQTPGVDYTWTSGTSITFIPAPPSGTNNILVRYWQALPTAASPDWKRSTFTQSGTAVAFNLISTPQREDATQIYINGVYQNKDTYSISGVTITFTEAPPLNSKIEVMYT